MVYTKADKYNLVPKGQMLPDKVKTKASFDLSEVNMVQIVKDLSAQINKPQPKGWIRKWWTNRMLPLDNDRLELLETYVERIKRINTNVSEMQAQLMAHPQILQHIFKGEITKAQLAVERQIKEHEDYVNEVETNKQKRKAEAMEKIAQAKKEIAEANIAEGRNELLKLIIEQIDPNYITPSQVLLITTVINPEQHTSLDSIDKSKLNEQQLKILKQEERSKKIQADYDEYKKLLWKGKDE